MSDRHQIYLPVSRFVSGSLTSKRTTNARRQPIPEDKQQFEFGLALRKDSPDVGAFFGQLINAAKACFGNNAQVHQIIDQWLQNGLNGFSMKLADGDQPNVQGAVNDNTRGCWVIYCSTSFPPVTADHTNAQIDPSQIERGYFVDATLSLAPNSNAIGDGIGVYMNPDMVRMRGVGEIIRGGIDTQAVGASMPMSQLPPGAQLPGMGPAGGGQPMPGMGQPTAPGMPPQAPGMPPQAPGMPQHQMPPQAPGIPQHQMPPQAPGMPPMGNAHAPSGGVPAPAPTTVQSPTGYPAPAPTSPAPMAPQTTSPTSGYPPYPGVLPQ